MRTKECDEVYSFDRSQYRVIRDELLDTKSSLWNTNRDAALVTAASLPSADDDVRDHLERLMAK